MEQPGSIAESLNTTTTSDNTTTKSVNTTTKASGPTLQTKGKSKNTITGEVVWNTITKRSPAKDEPYPTEDGQNQKSEQREREGQSGPLAEFQRTVQQQLCMQHCAITPHDVALFSMACPGPGVVSLYEKQLAGEDATRPKMREHASGSARTEGYYTYSRKEKQANMDLIHIPKMREAARRANAAPGSVKGSQRAHRAKSRNHTTFGEEASTQQINDLGKRHKRLKFAKSLIHSQGLYALENIPANDFVIEYLGEVVRAQVAETREKEYERNGMGSSYLFRIDDQNVIDATTQGNMSRFINHRCDPNCVAKIIKVTGQQRIAIYAKDNIAVGEEITYNYNFPEEVYV
ncbi:hypothetical protein SARC_05279 [Sphaeroforma arctica JP610]|uniref:[histone H3]-lysine(4) N-trimethyltransferase n=1 Tax=Sphaeroforma arctica JP610 TaxID=667725 RepID=A0A0L0G0Q1_9EUKA|nr:hypothetical protein SARC_05279 [Sphaeroforma arctica JP610]KNC82429.1 hypothetical protein SARC_05279 [Sphaeroforma arctica JP610]|eukprot:XP_014156331.1 hypothetical protein SARC_05279 [Sphaeroforma arctica JP610]